MANQNQQVTEKQSKNNETSPAEKQAMVDAEKTFKLLDSYIRNLNSGKIAEAEIDLKSMKKHLYEVGGVNEKKEVLKPQNLLAMEEVFSEQFASQLEDHAKVLKDNAEVLNYKKTHKGMDEDHLLLNFIEDKIKLSSDAPEFLLIFGLMDAARNQDDKISFKADTAVRFLHDCVNEKNIDRVHRDAAIAVLEIFSKHGGKMNELMSVYQEKYMPDQPKDNGLSAKIYFGREVFNTEPGRFYKDSTLIKFLKLEYGQSKNSDQVDLFHDFYFLMRTSEQNRIIKFLSKPEEKRIVIKADGTAVRDITLNIKIIEEIFNRYYIDRFSKDTSLEIDAIRKTKNISEKTVKALEKEHNTNPKLPIKKIKAEDYSTNSDFIMALRKIYGSSVKCIIQVEPLIEKAKAAQQLRLAPPVNKNKAELPPK